MTEEERANKRTEVQRQRADASEAQRHSEWRWRIAMILTVIMASAGTLYISGERTRQSERKLCAIVTSMDESYRETPPSTAAGRAMAVNLSDLRQQLGCPNKEK